jgi:hypothetical protein
MMEGNISEPQTYSERCQGGKQQTQHGTTKPAAIGHCVRSFRNDAAVWWEEVIPSDNSPKMLKVIMTWQEFEILFRWAWKIKATMTSVSWMENNRQKPNKKHCSLCHPCTERSCDSEQGSTHKQG